MGSDRHLIDMLRLERVHIILALSESRQGEVEHDNDVANLLQFFNFYHLQRLVPLILPT